MKKLTLLLIVASVFAGIASTSYAEFKRFNVYTDKASRDNHYVPSGWMGDWGDIKIDAGWRSNTHAGDTCIRIVYSAQQKQGAGWAGVYWQNPAGNWGDKKGGFDLTGASKLIFWARGDKGNEVLAEVKMGGLNGEYPDSDIASIGPIILSSDWKQYTIDLRGKDLSYIAGGFCWTATIADNPDGFIIYLDDIYYE